MHILGHILHKFLITGLLSIISCVTPTYFASFGKSNTVYNSGISSQFKCLPIPVGYVLLYNSNVLHPAKSFIILRVVLPSLYDLIKYSITHSIISFSSIVSSVVSLVVSSIVSFIVSSIVSTMISLIVSTVVF